jgi:hypothetical protein
MPFSKGGAIPLGAVGDVVPNEDLTHDGYFAPLF